MKSVAPILGRPVIQRTLNHLGLGGTAWFQRLFERRHSRRRWEQLASGLGRPSRRWLDRTT